MDGNIILGILSTIVSIIGYILKYYILWTLRLVRWIGIPLFLFGSLLGLGSALSIVLTSVVALGLFYLYLKNVYNIDPLKYFNK